MDIPYALRRAAGGHGATVAVRDDRGERTYAELAARAAQVANALIGLGLQRGDRVAVLLDNRLEYPEIDLGITSGGMVRVALNARLGLDDFRFVVEDSGARAIVTEARFDDVASALAAETAIEWIRLGSGGAPSPARDYDALLERASATLARGPDLTDAPAWISYTSGTTGRPKGVVLTQRALWAVAMNVLLELGPVDPSSSILLPQALSHGAGYFVLPYLVSGGTLRIMSRFEPDRALAIGESEAVGTLKLVPTMLGDLLDVLEPGRVSPFDTIVYGAAPIAAPQLERALERLGPVLVQVYGQSEAPVTITCLTKADHAAPGPHRASNGRPWRSVQVEVLRADGGVADPGEVGEVVVRGPHQMAGYHNRPDLTADVVRNGFVWTRDLAVTDERGYIYLKGRSDDMINSGGFNIAPKEVEDVLAAHPAVKECVVVGAPDPRWGEAVTACVVLADGANVTERDLDSFAEPALGFRRPRSVVFVDALPRTAYGKIDRRRLRDDVVARLTGTAS